APRSIAYTLRRLLQATEASGRATSSRLPTATLIRGQPISVARRSLRAELAKEEYATTWQEEEQGEPQEERVARPEIHRRPRRKALDTLARTRVSQDQCTKERGTKERGSKGSGSKRSGSKRSGQ